MKKLLLVGLFFIATGQASFAQFGGSAGSFAGSAGSYGGNGSTPAQLERLKRQPTNAEIKDDGNATFIDASILMNVKADEYVAVFGVMEEGKTPAEASAKMDAAVATFKASLTPLGVRDEDMFVDFVTQNRIYGYILQDKVAKEQLAGFELKKNVSIHFKDKNLVDQLVLAASKVEIYDLIKVDYIVKNQQQIQADLQAKTMELIRNKAATYEKKFSIKLPAPTQIIVDKPSVYFPLGQYTSYQAAEGEQIENSYRNDGNYVIQKARKSNTTFFNPLDADGYDTVVNPIIIEPIVQFTTYIKVKYGSAKRK